MSEACHNTTLIAKKCLFLKEKPPSLPKIKSNGLDENTLLTNYSFDGLKKD